MKSKQSIISAINIYLQQHPDEASRLQLINEFLDRNVEEQLYNRKNFDGHFTASAFILNKKKDSLLMLQHKFLQKWLQPGGHIDAQDESIINAALREATEETGIPGESLELLTNAVFDFDSHKIPANPKKDELEHYHHDVRFLFVYNENKKIEISEEESTAAQWIPLSKLEDGEFTLVVKKINELI